MDKYINLNSDDRFIRTDLLRSSYLTYEETKSPGAPNYVTFKSEDLELGIASGYVPEISRAVSSILSRSLEDGKYTNGGYLPPEAVERVQREIISPFGITNLWGTTGHRFVLSRPAGPDHREIVASILVARSKDTIFFFTGRYNNLKHSTMKDQVDLNQPFESDPNQKWFDKFAFPDLDVFKPKLYHQIGNFVVTKELRRQGLARFLLDSIVKYYSRDYLALTGSAPEHSQHLLCGKGFWQVGDPPWLVKMQRLGFGLRAGAESFFIEQDWSPLSPIMNDGVPMTNIQYNESFDMPGKYNHLAVTAGEDHLLDRVPEVIALSRNPRAKLQYFQALFNFL